MTIWDCRTHVPMTSMTSLVERTDLDFKISVALECTEKTLIRLGGCPGWSESSLGTQSFCWFCHEAAQLILFALHIYPPGLVYRKFPKISDTQKICSNHSKIWTMWLYRRVMCPNDADGMANSVDPDQTALGAVWSGSALFAQAYLSENLGSLRYCMLTFVSLPLTIIRIGLKKKGRVSAVWCIYDCCCVKRALKVSELHNLVTIQDTDMFDTSF